MFAVFSKLAWMVLAPSSLLVSATVIGALLATSGRRRRSGRVLSIAAATALLLCAFGPVGYWLAVPLETRFPLPAHIDAPVSGIVVLGGAAREAGPLGDADMLGLNEAAERLSAMILLARRYPQARLVYSGGQGDPFDPSPPEADLVRAHVATLGLDPSRILFENRSRNTAENASFSRDTVRPQQGERWLLVTSAWHMPRAMGCFSAAGFEVEPFPVDFRTNGWSDLWRLHTNAGSGLRLTDTATREWLGLVAYRLTGRIGALLPAPR